MSLKKLFGIVKLITKFYRLLSSLFRLSLFSPKQRNKRTDERNLKIKDIKKSPKGLFLNGCDRVYDHAYAYEILHSHESANSYQTVRNIRHSYLQASFETVAIHKTSLGL